MDLSVSLSLKSSACSYASFTSKATGDVKGVAGASAADIIEF
jgi:hypothetical protein